MPIKCCCLQINKELQEVEYLLRGHNAIMSPVMRLRQFAPVFGPISDGLPPRSRYVLAWRQDMWTKVFLGVMSKFTSNPPFCL